MREGPLASHRWRTILLPSLAAALLPFVLVWLPPAHWQPVSLAAAAALTFAIALSAFCAPWERLPAWAPSVLPFAYLSVVALLRQSGGPSGVAPVALLSVFWIGLVGTRKQLVCLLAGVVVVFCVPLVAGGTADDPPGTWRAAILFIAVSGLIGATVQALVARVREQERERRNLLEKLEQLAHTDALTGLPNRRAWEAELDRGVARARRTGQPLSVALIDIDSFKEVNDLHGHPVGDSLLEEIGRLWARALRPDDVLARIGGDEFAVLMPGCTEGEASEVIGRLRVRMPSPHSCSVGVATWDRAEVSDELIRRTDDALYAAKRAGRDRAAAAGPVGTPGAAAVGH